MTEKEKSDVLFNLSQMRKWLSGEPADIDCPKFISALSIAETAVSGIKAEPGKMIPQIREFRERFEELHEGTPRFVFCNEKTFRELEIEAGVGYIPKPANKCPTAYGMVFIVPEDGQIIIGNGYIEKYSFKGAGK